MSAKIIIDFDGEEEKPDENSPERIIIEFNDEKPKIEIEEIEKSYEEIAVKSEVDCFYRGNSGLSNSFNTELIFPEGIEKGFRRKFSLNVEDEFLNSPLENNRFIVLSSCKGNIYLIDRFSGRIKESSFHENEAFEKTGLILRNVIFLNSLRRIYRIDTSELNNTKTETVHSCEAGYYIWSSLNRFNDSIVFTENNIQTKKARLKILNVSDPKTSSEFEFEVNNYVSDRVCVASGIAYVIFDSSILAFDLEKLTGSIYPLNIETDENSFLFYLNYKLYITTRNYEVYYIDLPPVNYRFRYSGIRNNYMNSIGGFADNIFTGTLDGWSFYKSSGLKVHSYEDEYENRIECISKNILALSQKNRIVFCNLNRFQEAESYVISSEKYGDAVEIVSAVFSAREILVLTKNGQLESFTNDKMNIHI